MSLRKKGLVLAMEDDAAEVEAPENMEEEMMEAEEAEDEVIEASEEVEEIADAAEDAAEDAETLERLKGVMDDSVEEGEGLSETSAEIAEVSIEAICDRLGIENKNLLPATESFGSTSSRVTATRIASEAVDGMITKIWNAIKAAFSSMWNKLKAIFANLTKNAKAMGSYIESLQKRADATDSSVAKKEEVLKKSGIIKYFTVDGKASLENAKEIIANVLKASKGLSGTSGGVEKVLAGVGTITEAAVKKDAKVEDVTDLLKKSKAFNDVTSAVSASTASGFDFEDKDGSNTATATVGPLLGGKTYKIVIVKEDASISFSMTDETPESGDKVEEIAALDLNDVKALLKTALELNSSVIDNKDVIKNIDNMVKDANKTADKVIKAADDVPSEMTASIKGLKKTLQTANVFSTKVVSMVPSISLSTVKAAGMYASASLDNLEVAK